jgi:hypothetical protein
MPQRRGRTFAIKQWPVFGRGPYSDAKPPRAVAASPYFWWFRFLQLNDEYQRAIHGHATTIDPAVVSALGPVRDTDFKTWWRSHSELFAEPITHYDMCVAETRADLAPMPSTDAVNVVVPLGWNALGLKRKFGKLVDQLVATGRVRPAQRGFMVGDAEFKITRKCRTDAMHWAYQIYVVKHAAMQQGHRVTWADAAIKAQLPAAHATASPGEAYSVANHRRKLVVVAKRYYSSAEEMIAAAATKCFPDLGPAR